MDEAEKAWEQNKKISPNKTIYFELEHVRFLEGYHARDAEIEWLRKRALEARNIYYSEKIDRIIQKCEELLKGGK